MSLDLDKWKEILDSPEVQARMDAWAKLEKEKQDVLEARLVKVEKYLNENGIEQLMSRLIKEHGEDYSDKCYKKGYEPYPNNKLKLLYSFVEENYSPVHNDLIPQDFLSSSYFFKGYWFTVYCGQGCFYRIYNHKLENILQP
jgi:hypothetical protein